MGLNDRHTAPPGGASDTTERGPFQLAAIDIDDTLLGRDGEISRENRDAVERLRRSGARIVLASGRSHGNMLRFHHALQLGSGPIVSAQGAMVREALSGDRWHEDPAPAAGIAAVTRDGLDRGFSVQHYRGDGIYIQARSAWTEYDQTRNDEAHVLVPSLESVGWDGVFKVIWLGDPGAIAAVAADARACHADALSVTETDPGYLEFGAPGASKGVAVAAVARRLGIPREAVVAFGDGNNDVPMLRWAGLGVAMPHGRPAAWEAAARIAPAGNPDSALARAIDALLRGAALAGIPEAASSIASSRTRIGMARSPAGAR